MRRPLLLALSPLLSAVLIAAEAVTSADQNVAIRATDTRGRIGQLAIVEDDVAQVTREPQSGFTFLNFGAEFPRQVFRVVLPTALESKLPGPLHSPLRVRIQGRDRYNRCRCGCAAHTHCHAHGADAQMLPSVHDRPGVRRQLH